MNISCVNVNALRNMGTRKDHLITKFHLCIKDVFETSEFVCGIDSYFSECLMLFVGMAQGCKSIVIVCT